MDRGKRVYISPTKTAIGSDPINYVGFTSDAEHYDKTHAAIS